MDNQRTARQKGWRNEREGGMMESRHSISRPSGPLGDEGHYSFILSFFCLAVHPVCCDTKLFPPSRRAVFRRMCFGVRRLLAANLAQHHLQQVELVLW